MCKEKFPLLAKDVDSEMTVCFTSEKSGIFIKQPHKSSVHKVGDRCDSFVSCFDKEYWQIIATSESEPTIQDFIGEKVSYDECGCEIYGESKSKMNLLLEVRGWVEILHLFKGDAEKTSKFHDTFGEWVADAINEKLKREQVIH